MKKIRTLYWIFTGLFCTFMLLSSVTQSLSLKGTEEIMDQLRFPLYILPFLGVTKLLGVAAIVTPGFPKIKEWAYAGFIFDMSAALYSMIAAGGSIDKWAFMLLPILLCVLSYIFYHKKITRLPEMV